MGASPSSSLATLRPDLATFEEFDIIRDMEGFIGLKVFPKFTSQVQAGTFGRIPIEALLKQPETKRAPRSGYSRRDWQFTTDSFATEERGVEEPIDDREAKIYANYFDAEVIARNRGIRSIIEAHERDVAAATFNTTTYTGSSLTTAVSVQWSTPATATPVTDVENAVLKVWANSGIWPNALVLSKQLFRKLRFCSQIIDMAKAQNFMDVRPGSITAAQLAVVFDLEQIIVAGGSKDTAAEGQTTVVASIWDKSMAMVCKVSESNDISLPCIGRTIEWAGDGGVDGVVETYRDETIRGEVVRVRNDRQVKRMYTEMGHLLTNCSA